MRNSYHNGKNIASAGQSGCRVSISSGCCAAVAQAAREEHGHPGPPHFMGRESFSQHESVQCGVWLLEVPSKFLDAPPRDHWVARCIRLTRGVSYDRLGNLVGHRMGGGHLARTAMLDCESRTMRAAPVWWRRKKC